MSCDEDVLMSRRALLTGGASLALWGQMPKMAAASTRQPRLLLMVLRGGMDGLSVAAPLGDPDYANLRGSLALGRPGSGAHAGLALDNFFALHPSMPYLHKLYKKREASIIHAVATSYRGRSHFDGQDVLEGGFSGSDGAAPGNIRDGWLNRALSSYATQGTLIKAGQKGVSIGPTVPLVMRGKAPILSWTPKSVLNAKISDATAQTLMDLYVHTDPYLAKMLGKGLEMERISGAGSAMAQPLPQKKGGRFRKVFIETAAVAARLMSPDDGPRVGTLSYTGWDTHFAEGAEKGMLANALTGLDAALATYAEGMGPAWRDTVVVIVTEFGRTARANGTGGTDHGTATTALLAGGAVRGGRVLCDWPGLRQKALYQGRDLMPTQDLRAVLKGVLHDHLDIPASALGNKIFPQSRGIRPLPDLIV